MMLSNRPGLRRWLLTIGAVVLLGGAFMAGRVVHLAPPGADGRPAAATTADAHDEHDTHGDDAQPAGETTYYCSMHPDQRSTDPNATCPICGMAMVPMPDDAEADDDDLPVLRLSERSVRLLDIQTSPVERREARAELRFVAQLEADETRLRDVVVRAPSYVETLHANYQWQHVSKGEPIAELYSPQITAASRELLVIERNRSARRNSDTALAAAKARLERLGVMPEQIERIIEADEAPRTYTLRSPIDGHVMHLRGRAGHWLGEGDRLLQIMDPSRLWMEMAAYERDLSRLRQGLPAELTVEAYPGETFEGEVSFIDPHLDPRTRTVSARVEVDNPDGRLKPGMFARGRVSAPVSQDETEQPPLLIPRTAPLITGERAIVYVRRPNAERPSFEGREIVLGPRVGEHYIVREGLDEGERVVTHGQFKLDSELQIRSRPSMMGRDALFQPHDHQHGQQQPPEQEHDVSTADVPEDYPLEVCVVSGEPLGSMGEPVVHEHEGRTVVFCCPGCIPTFEDDPQRYLSKIDEARQ